MTSTLRPDLGEPVMPSLLARVATSLGWTQGQVWTVALGLVLAVPGAIFGLGPALQDAVDEPLAVDRPPAEAAASAASADPPAAPAAPTLLGGGATALGAATSSPSAATSPATEPPGTAAVVAEPVPGDTFATLGGPGQVVAVAVAADAVALVVETAPDDAGRVVVLDGRGGTAFDGPLTAGDRSYARPGGIAVTRRGLLVATADPPAIVRIDVADGEVTEVAALPDLPLCVPLAAATGCQPGMRDTAPRPRHLAVAPEGDLFVADEAQACLVRVPAGAAEGESWHCDLTFAGSPVAPSGGVAGVAVDDRRVVFSVASGLDGRDLLVEVARADRGGAGARRTLAEPPRGAASSGVALLADGRVVLALPGGSALLVVDPDGASRVVPVDGQRPVDLDALGDDLYIVANVDGGPGSVSKRALGSI